MGAYRAARAALLTVIPSYLLLLLYYRSGIPYSWTRLIDFAIWTLVCLSFIWISLSIRRAASLWLVLFAGLHAANQWKIENFIVILYPADLLVPLQLIETGTGISAHLLASFVAAVAALFLFFPLQPQKTHAIILSTLCAIFGYAVVTVLITQVERIMKWEQWDNSNAARHGWLLASIIESAEETAARWRTSSPADTAAAIQELGAQGLILPLKPISMPAPLVVSVQMESFFDPASRLDISSCIGTDLLNPLHRATRLAVPTFGGGSAATGFEVICGLPALVAAPRAGSEFRTRLANHPPCLPALLRDQGVQTAALYPFAVDFFSETTAYSNAGFEEVLRPATLPGMQYEGEFLSNNSLYSFAAQYIEEHRDRPLYLHIETAAGHIPQAIDYARHPKVITCPADGEKETTLNLLYYNYEALLQFVSEVQRLVPNAVVFGYGDHLPIYAHDRSSDGLGNFKTPLFTFNFQSMPQELPAYLLPHVWASGFSMKERTPYLRTLPGGHFAVQIPPGGAVECTQTDPESACQAGFGILKKYQRILHTFLYGASEDLRAFLPKHAQPCDFTP